jgi:hypothetical protein
VDPDFLANFPLIVSWGENGKLGESCGASQPHTSSLPPLVLARQGGAAKQAAPLVMTLNSSWGGDTARAPRLLLPPKSPASQTLSPGETEILYAGYIVK